ncbi:hypothetical protein Dsin_021336 [Dipteronia sinensis]|uniref:RNase H type-1 domain-containing protein n=1 Tax=Dipteronia sinensis TaxID=43782 RepID=A0AAE0DYW7_9ROSI|nr:hypothetical protein Dsin_021336 [Dipteronia sinensis]
MAIHRACTICTSRQELVGKQIVIVSDSKVTVSWIHDEKIGSVNHVQMIYDIRNMLSFLQNTAIVHNSRAQNAFADSLEKKASKKKGDVLEWS